MEQFHLKWHTYDDHLKEMMKNLMLSHESSDVTLVCEDKTKFKAHKFVLKACSPVFQSKINELPQKDPVIYLRGVHTPEMESILQFMNLGQATFLQDRMNDFLNVAKSLRIKEISKDVSCDVDDLSQDLSCDENVKYYMGNSHEEDTIENPKNKEGVVDHIDTKVISLMNEGGQYPCNKCDKQFSKKVSLYDHHKRDHEGIRFPCHECDYKATKNRILLFTFNLFMW